MVKIPYILGMNARDQLFCSLNSLDAKRFGFSKIRAKEFLRKHGIGIASLYAVLTSPEEIRTFDWKSIYSGFVIKPSNGSAGKGVLVIKEYNKRQKAWQDVEGKYYTEDDLRFHASNILDGQYSTWGSFPNVIIEERVPIHPDLEQYVQYGTPDVRVIVFNKIPVMAMTRLPTKESGGRANLDQGAIGLGIDMGTGKTTYGVSGKKKVFRFFPGAQQSTAGIQIPFWMDVLKTAVRAANATGLTYMGADIFVHPEKGPIIAEVNAYPGLSIQVANQAGLRKRLERIEDIEARNVNHAVKIGQSLFAETYPLESEGDVTVIGPKEEVEIYGEHKRTKRGIALINTAREWSAIAYGTAKELGLADMNQVLWTEYAEGSGKEVVVQVKYKLHGHVKTTAMVVSKRLNEGKYILHLGRRDLSGFLVSMQRSEA
ncbi:MAG TPA: sugar-transfer associated ATP-grasp domain-containing protein [Patescibacteria group bacterium]|nr:sugar-transfer associated ATP-grasp domain-containing protein [Patescibacteria group bacterium]